MPFINYAEAKRRISMRQVLGLLRWHRVRTEAGWDRGGCPVHQRGREHGDCFAACRWGWKCHKCGRHGDQLRLWAEATGQPIYPATLILCQLLGVGVADVTLRRSART